MYLVFKRIFDLFSSFIGLVILSPFLILIAIAISLESRGGVFFIQKRVGKGNRDFHLLKFRSMRVDAESKGQLTVGNRDPRITKVGRFIRRFKLDEFPQLFNVITGNMSIVGPRPEVRKYVEMYSDEQMKVLNVRPGLTDYASLEYIDEDEVLAKADDPEKAYVETIMPAKLKLNLKYIDDMSLSTDLKIIFKTIGKIFR